jgi:malonyl CoA-acyl carrier protein transacylase
MSGSLPPVAIVGIGAMFPGRGDTLGFWRDILEGADAIGDVPPTHWLVEDYYDADPAAPDKTYGKRGGFLRPQSFDPLAFGVPPAQLAATDTAQLLALIVAKEALDQARRSTLRGLDPERTSVVLGVASATELVAHMASRLQRPAWVKAMREAGLPESQVETIADSIASNYAPWQEATFPGLLGNVVAGRIANRLDLGGANFVTDAACASSLSAVQVALHELAAESSDAVLAGGVDALNDILMYMCFSKTPALSPTGDCRPFSDRADGTVLGEGVGIVALRRLSDAERDGNSIYAVIRGVGAGSDGRATAIYAPLAEGQARTLRRAYESAGYAPSTVELIEAHGTGTKAGDAAELKALSTVFAEADARPQSCALGSVKSQIGHTKAAAGAASLIKAALALHHGVLPPTIKVERPAPALRDGASPFYVNTRARPWIRGRAHPRRASVSSFGFGGSDFHLALEEYDGAARAPRLRALPAELVLLSADGDDALARQLDEARAEVADDDDFARLADRSHRGFDASAPRRLALVARDAEDFRAKTQAAQAQLADGGRAPWPADLAYGANPPIDGAVAFLFPGQGSQYVGMGADLAMSFPDARAAWDAAADAPELADAPIHELVFPPPRFSAADDEADDARLREMVHAQPALAAASLALLRVLDRIGLRPAMAAGHSFGEVIALHAAGVVDADAAMGVARRRAEAMANAAAASEGGMLAVPRGRAEVEALLREAALDVVLANDNAPEQVVLSGRLNAIAAAEAALAARGIVAKRLNVASAFHSELVAAAEAPFRAELERRAFGPCGIPVYSNVTTAPYPDDPETMKALLAEQLVRPVRFRELLGALQAAGARVFVEVGPGAVLTGLVEAGLAGRGVLAVALDRKRDNGVVSLWRGLGRLAAAGVALDVAALLADQPAPPKPAARSPHAVEITGANYAKPYPPKGGAAALPKPNPEPASAAPPPAPARTTETVETMAKDPTPAPASEIAAIYADLAAKHEAYLAAMTRAHEAFLQTSQALVSGRSRAPDVPEKRSAARRDDPLPPPLEGKGERGRGARELVGGVSREAAASVSIASPAPSSPPPHPPAPSPSRGGGERVSLDAAALLRAIVAEKTGYPEDMLGDGMDLEAELGVDSIKQVEILATLRERAPDLPEVDPARLATLRSIGAIAAFLGESATRGGHPVPPPLEGKGASGRGGAVNAVGQAREPERSAATALASPSHDAAALLRAIVAEKTGYPEDMLGDGMDLEAELGVDSIKQVEILATLRERAPELPEVDPAQLATLRSIGAIAAFLGPTAGADAAPAAPPEAQISPAPPPIRVRAVEFRSRPASGVSLAGFRDARRIEVTDDGGAFAEALVAELCARDLPAERVEILSGVADAVIVATGVGSTRTSHELHWAALAHAKAAEPQLGADGGCFVTIQDTGGSFSALGGKREAAWRGGLAGLAKTAAREWPKAAVKAIDVDADEDAADAARRVADELLAGGPELEVGLSAAHGRVVPVLVAPGDVQAPANDVEWLRENMVLVASGGARGVTAQAMLALAQATPLRVALLGRTAPIAWPEGFDPALDETKLRGALARAKGAAANPADIAVEARRLVASREIEATLAALRAHGSEAAYHALDVADARAVKVILNRVRADWGPIEGIVHGAGALADKRIAEKTKAQLRDVFRPKVAGLKALLEATSADPLRVIAVFSSVAGRFGNAGQADYAMANEVIARVAWAEARRRPQCVVRAFDWGPWAGGMVDASLKRRFEAAGVGLIPLAEGGRIFAETIATRDGGAVERVVGSAAPNPSRAMSADLVVRAGDPLLAAHRIEGAAVLPAMMALDWFAGLAEAAWPDADALTLEDFEILAGVSLGADPRAEVRLRLEAAGVPGEPGALALTLADAEGRARYRAVARVAADDAAARAPNAADWPAWQLPLEDAYGGPLFHGRAFRALTTLVASGEDGAEAEAKPAHDAGRATGLDVTCLDAGLQTALLWGLERLGGGSLPTRIARYTRLADARPGAPVRIVLRSRRLDARRARHDIAYRAVDGTLLAVIEGLEMTAAPALARAPQARRAF